MLFHKELFRSVESNGLDALTSTLWTLQASLVYYAEKAHLGSEEEELNCMTLYKSLFSVLETALTYIFLKRVLFLLITCFSRREIPR